MKTTGYGAAIILFELTARILGKEDYQACMAFLDNQTPATDHANKQSCAAELHGLIAELSAAPDNATIEELTAITRQRSPVTRAYFACYLGEQSGRLQHQPELILPEGRNHLRLLRLLLRGLPPIQPA